MPYARDNPKRKYVRQRWHAKRRGIEWLITYEEWWAVWEQSGKWDQRGKEPDQYVMARFGDVGPYSTANVFICTFSENVKQAWANGRTSPPPSNLGTGRGWSFIKTNPLHPYEARARGKCLGRFATAEEAEAAYRAAVCSIA